MTVRCRKCKEYMPKDKGIRQGISYVCLDCVQIPKTIPCYNDVVSDDNFACRLCGTKWTIQVHHITYRSQGGEDVYENLITLCQRCHAKVHAAPKADYTPRLEAIVAARIRDSCPPIEEF